MMRRDTYNNIVKTARLLSLVVLMAFGAGLKGWGQTIKSNYPSQYGQSVDTLYVKINEPKTVRFQEDASESIDGYISWYVKHSDNIISINEISDGGLTKASNRKYWLRSNNSAPSSNVSSVYLTVNAFPTIPDTLILEASTFNEFSNDDSEWTSPLITIQKKYVIKNASYRSADLTNRRTELNNKYSDWYNNIISLKDALNKSDYFLDVYEIHTPLKSLSGVYGTNYRLSEKLSNYYVGNNTSEANQVRWTVYDVNGNFKKSYTTNSNIWDHTFGQDDGVNISDNKTQIVYVVAEVASGSSVWYPVSFLTIYLEPNSEVITESNFNDDAYKHRTTEYLEENGYLKISEVSFDDGLIPFSDLNASNNFLNSPISNANSVYAYAYPGDFMERKGNRLSAGRNEYGLYRSLNYYEGSNKNVSHGYVSINNDKGLYNDWFSGQGRDNYQEQVYNKYILDRTYYKTNKTQLGHFLYLDASDDPGVITKINLNEKLCPSTSLVFTAWICDMAHQTTATHADIGFTLKGVKGNSETILTKFYSGKINNSPENIDINTINQGEEYGPANWQQVYFSFSFDSPEEAEYDSYILEVSNNCPNSNGADYAIDDIQVWRSTPNIEVIRLDACEADSLTVSSDYETLLRNMGWTEGEPVVTKGHIYNGAVLDENLIKYRLGLNGADPSNPTTATENSYVGNTYFSFVEGFQDDNGMTLKDVTGDPSKEPDPIILPEDKDDVDYYRWVRINKSLQIPSHTATYAFRAIVTTQSPNSTPNYTYPKSREEALKYERVFNLRAVKDFNYLLKNWDVVYGKYDIPKPDWLSTADVQSITVSDELQKSPYYTITDIADISGLLNMLPNEVEAYDKAITELYTHLLIPRIRVPWYVDGTMYLYTVDVRNTDLKHNGESVLNADGTTSTATGKYHVVLQGANAVESWDPETAATATFNLLDPCLLISPFTLYGSIQITVEAETDLSARACAGTQRKISAQLLSKDDGEPLTGVDYSFDWFLGGGYEKYWEISVDGYDLKSMLAAVRDDESFLGEITYANVNSWDPADGTKQAIRNKLLELLNPEDAKLVTNKTEFSWLLSADSLVAMPFVTQGAANTSYCTEITAAPVPLYSTDVPELHPGFTGITSPFEGEVSLRLGHPNMGFTTTGDKIVLKVPLSNEIKMSASAVSLGLADDEVPIMLNNIEAQYPKIGLATNMSIEKNATDGTVTIQLNEGAKTYLQEGQCYELLIPFVQYDGFGQPLASECDGLISLPVKIVPEYLTWKGESTDDNWYDESMWNQSTKKELYFDGWNGANADKDANGPDAEGNYEDIKNAFSPLYFTKITIPENSELALKEPSTTTIGNYQFLNGWAEDGSDSIRYEMAVADANGTISPYYINKVDQIYFKPNASLYRQDYLTYNKAWVDFEMEEGKPYWMSAPLQNVYAGDMYAPSSNGRQETAAFEDITYNGVNEEGNDLNSRWSPAFYQKAWDKAISYVHSGTAHDANNATDVAAVKSNWSIEYNDVWVPYSKGKGFYARVEDLPEANKSGKALVRLPKADIQYSYETKAAGNLSNGENISRDNAYDLLDKVNGKTGTNIEINLDTEVDGDGTHFLVGNPYMTYLDMKAFFDNNTNLNRKFWTLDRNEGSIVVGTPDISNWSGNDVDGYHTVESTQSYVAPMTAFFVELSDNAGDDKTIEFTTAMMAAKPTTTNNVYTKSYSASNPILTLTAERGETRSVARLLTSDKGHDEYEASEDAVLLLDSELDAPMVYTVAGDVAAQFNTLRSIKNVPLGVYADKGEEVELTIRGISQFAEKLYLYDAVTKQSTPLDDDSYTFRVTGPSHGRFTLTSQNRISAESDICVYSPTLGQLLVMSSPEEPLQRIQVYDISGRMVVSRNNVRNTTCQLTVPSGIYVVYAASETGDVRVKIKVR